MRFGVGGVGVDFGGVVRRVWRLVSGVRRDGELGLQEWWVGLGGVGLHQASNSDHEHVSQKGAAACMYAGAGCATAGCL